MTRPVPIAASSASSAASRSKRPAVITVARSNSRPTTAATVSRSLASCESRERRRPTTSRTPSGSPRSSGATIAHPHAVALVDRAGLDEVQRRPPRRRTGCPRSRRAGRARSSGARRARPDRRASRPSPASSSPLERDPGDPRLAPKVGEHLGERMPAVDVGVAVRREEEHRARAVRLEEPPQQSERRPVGPVHVVEHEQQRAAAR